MSEQPQKTEVNYEAVNLDSMGPSDPMDDAMAFKALLGSVASEFHQNVNENMVAESTSLKKIDPRRILEKGVSEIMGQQRNDPHLPPEIQQPQPIPQPIPQPQPQTNGAPVPQVQIQPELPPQPQEDPNQLTLNFDNTATAQDIFNKLDNLEAKLNKLTKLVENLTPPKKKPVVKK